MSKTDECQFCCSDKSDTKCLQSDICKQRYLFYKHLQQSRIDLQILPLKQIPECLSCRNYLGNVCIYCQIPLDDKNQGMTLSNLNLDNQLCRQCENYKSSDKDYWFGDNFDHILVCHLDHPKVILRLINNMYGDPSDYIWYNQLNYEVIEYISNND